MTSKVKNMESLKADREFLAITQYFGSLIKPYFFTHSSSLKATLAVGQKSQICFTDVNNKLNQQPNL